MNAFQYLSNSSISDQYKIYNVVRSLEPYAKSIYGSSWEDALDCSFFHILNNFDESKGNLNNYAIRVVKTINLNIGKDEYADDEKTTLGLDLKSAREYMEGRELIFEDSKSKDIASCIKDLVDLYSNDCKFFATHNPKDRKSDYSFIFNNYSSDVIMEAKNYLVDKYSDAMANFIKLADLSNIRKYSEDRYLKNLDTNTTYLNEINGIIIISRKRSSHMKFLYKIDIASMLNNIIDKFYRGDGAIGVFSIEHINVYLSMSGKIVNSLDTLKSYIEDELIGSVLSRTSLKVINYQRGNKIIFTSTKDTQGGVAFNAFNEEFSIEFEGVVAKEVNSC